MQNGPTGLRLQTQRGLVMRGLLALAVCGAALTTAPACDATECGPGTLESGARCVPATSGHNLDECSCGPGTHLDAVAGGCVLDEPVAYCGVGSVGELDDDGTTVCVGTGTGPSCDPWCSPAMSARSITR